MIVERGVSRGIRCVVVCGARPNFMKVASLIRAFGEVGGVESVLVHTGQHYDKNMSDVFFRDLGMPEPDLNLDCGSGTHAIQTASIMRRFEPVLLERRPDWVIVVGDVNSTLACALTAVKLGVKVAHVEAGLRSYDRAMPEEVNRVLTDHVSELLFVTEPAGMVNLRREGVDAARCHLVGDTLADTLRRSLPQAHRSTVHRELGLSAGEYGLVTLHRPSNVDDVDRLRGIFAGLAAVAENLPLVFPAHPRTVGRLRASGLAKTVEASRGVRVVAPQGYLDFLKLMADARLVISDSGGIQEETTILGVPCMTLRDTTERPYTVEFGTNRLVTATEAGIRAAAAELVRAVAGAAPEDELIDGRAGQRIAGVLVAYGA